MMSTSSPDFAPACHGMHLPLRDLGRENRWENSNRGLHHRVILLTPTTKFSKIEYGGDRLTGPVTGQPGSGLIPSPPVGRLAGQAGWPSRGLTGG